MAEEKTTQDGRLLRISTDLGKDFLLINSMTGTEALSELFSFQIEVLHEESEYSLTPTPVDLKKVIGQRVIVEILQPDDTLRYFNAMVRSFTQGMRQARFSVYTMEVVPAVWVLTQVHQSRIFQHKSTAEILEEVLKPFDVRFELSAYKKRNYCVQYRESDFNFISRLMEEEGIFYFFEHDEKKHTMVVADSPRSHPDCPSKSDIPFYTTADNEGHFATISQFEESSRLQTGKVTLWDHHFQLPGNRLEEQKVSLFEIGDNRDLEIYDYPGGYARKFDGIDTGGGDATSELEKVFEEKRKAIGIVMQSIDSGHTTYLGSGDCSSMAAGHRFSLSNHQDESLNGPYVVTSVEHRLIQSPTYISDESPPNAYANEFAAIKQGSLRHGPGSPPFRPRMRTPKPTVLGSQTAVVVGPAGEEIFTDKYGRVKVQFNWDREGRFDSSSSCWLRVSTSIAGNQWGTMYIPRVGQEVIVDFLEGDPDQPIIVGSVYNPQTMPHYDLPKFKTLTYIKTRTSPDDGKGYNELRFEDKAGKEQVFVRSQKRYDLRVRGSMYETCGGSRNEVIGLKQENQPGGNLAVTVAGCYDLHVKEDHFIGIDGKLNEAVKGEVVEDYQSSLSTMVKTKAQLNALEILLEAKTKISLKVGGNCIMIDPSGITIAGTMVKINSGGFATGCTDPSIEDPLDAEISDNGEPGYLDRPRSGGGRRGRNRRTLRGQHYVAPPRPGEDPRMTAIRNTLADSEAGRHALEVAERYNIGTRFDNSDGYYYDPATNTMTMNPDMDQGFQTTGYVHEMNHGQAANEGNAVDVNNSTRADYVDRSLREEAHGDAVANHARRELEANGHDMSSSQTQSQAAYDRGYNRGVADARAANPNATADELEAAGRAAGEQEILDDYRNGRVQTSTPGNPTYPDYYGGAWDAAHPAPAGP